MVVLAVPVLPSTVLIYTWFLLVCKLLALFELPLLPVPLIEFKIKTCLFRAAALVRLVPIRRVVFSLINSCITIS